MRNSLRFTSALLAVVMLAGCGSSAASTSTAAADSSAQTQSTSASTTSGVLRVGMECNYAPFNWTVTESSDTAQPLESGDYCDGYDVVIATRLAEALGRTVEVHKLDWDNLIPNLQNNEIDAVIAGMTATPERSEQISFTDPYYTSEEVVIVKKGGSYDFGDDADIQQFSGAKLVGQQNTIYDTVIDQIDGVDHIQAATDFPAAINALQNGAVDGVVSELPVANGVTTANPDLAIVRFAEGHNFDADTSVSVGVRKEDTELLDQLNAALAEISTDERNQLMQDAVDRQPAND